MQPLRNSVNFLFYFSIFRQSTAITTDQNGSTGFERLVQSTPGSPQDRRPNSFEVIGSAESLVGRVSKIDVFVQLALYSSTQNLK